MSHSKTPDDEKSSGKPGKVKTGRSGEKEDSGNRGKNPDKKENPDFKSGDFYNNPEMNTTILLL